MSLLLDGTCFAVSTASVLILTPEAGGERAKKRAPSMTRTVCHRGLRIVLFDRHSGNASSVPASSPPYPGYSENFAAKEQMRILGFLELQEKKHTVGTLVLGKKSSFRELFFEKDRVFLCAHSYSGRIDIVGVHDAGLLPNVLSPSQLESLLLGDDLTKTLLPQILEDQGLLDDAGRLESFASSHILEEITEMLLGATESFAFQEGRVPESLLDRGGIVAHVSIPLSQLITDVRARLSRMEKIGKILASGEEVFVITAEGMQHKQTHTEDFALQRLLGLVDGLRNIAQIVNDSRFYELFTLELIARCLDREFIKKTLTPELRDVSTDTLSANEAARLLPYFKNSVKHSVNQIAARERLAVVHAKLGQEEDCVVQYNFIGDAYYGMKKPKQAIDAYRKALKLKPQEPLILDKITRIYHETADEQALAGEHSQAAELLRSALRLHPKDWQAFEKLADILATSGSQKDVADVCDEVTRHAKALGDPTIATRAYRIVLQKVDCQIGLQKKLVNGYIDLGDKKAAVAIMKEMIAGHLDADEPEKALELVEKILRVGERSNELVHLRKRLTRNLGVVVRKRRRSSRRVATACAMIAALLSYQAWSYFAWTALRTETVASAQTTAQAGTPPESATPPSKPLVSFRPSDVEVGCKEVASRYGTFLARFPFSIFSPSAAKLQREHEQQARMLASVRASRKTELLEQAKLRLDRRDRRGLSKVLTPLLKLGAGHPWRRQAETMLRHAATAARSSQELVDEARRLEDQHHPREAYKIYRRLLNEYPDSQPAAVVKLPVLVESKPDGCRVLRLSEEPERPEFLGTTPFVRKMSPGEIFRIELNAPGHSPLQATLDASNERPAVFVLGRKPVWSVPLATELSIDAVVTDEDVVLAYTHGQLRVLDVRTGRLRDSVSREHVYSVTSPPTVTKHGIYSVWNDGAIVVLNLDRGAKGALRRTSVRLPSTGHGMPTTTLVSIDERRVAIGTSRKKILLLHASGLTPIAEVALRQEPRYLERLNDTTLLATSVDGKLDAVSTESGQILWSRDLRKELELPPTRVGASLTAISVDRTLHLLDPANGEDRVPTTRLRTRDRVAVDRTGERLYLLNADTDLASISPQTGEVLAHHKPPIRPTGIVALDGNVGLLHRGGSALLVLDGASLSSTWAVSCKGDAYVELHSAGGRLVARTRSGRLLTYPSTNTPTP